MATSTSLKALLFVSVAALALAAPTPARAQDRRSRSAVAASAPTGPRLRLRIAVNQGKWEALQYQNYSIDPNVVRALQAKIIEKLMATGMFEVMERERTSGDQSNQEDVLAARRSAQGRGAAAAREIAVPADYVVTPEIVGFNVTSGGRNSMNLGGLVNRTPLGGLVGGARVSSGNTRTTAEMSLRIFSSSTRSMLDVASGKGECKKSNMRLDASILGAGMSQEQFAESPVGKAVEDAIDQAVDKMVARLGREPWKASVAGVSAKTGRITINRGSASGVAEGMEFTVCDVDSAGVDPDTGVQIPGDETPIGKVRIVRVEKDYAFAERVSGSGFKPKHIVRFAP